jgi:hypothetical protein
VRFLLPDTPALQWFHQGETLAPSTASETWVYAWPYEPLEPVLAVLPPQQLITSEAGPLYRGDLEPTAYPLYSLYHARPASAALTAATPLARFEGGFDLLAVTAPAAGPSGAVELVWRAATAPGRDYQVLAQASLAGELLAQADGPLGTALYPSRLWRTGELVQETRQFELPAGAAWADVVLTLGLYDLNTGQRLPRLDAAGDTLTLSPGP